MAHNYEEQVKEDVIAWYNENIGDEWEVFTTSISEIIDDWDKTRDQLDNEDCITGNASGSYYCNSQRAKEMIFDSYDEVLEALEYYDYGYQEIGEMFMNEEWEKIDVIARCYWLTQIDIDEISYDITEAYIEALRG